MNTVLSLRRSARSLRSLAYRLRLIGQAIALLAWAGNTALISDCAIMRRAPTPLASTDTGCYPGIV